jgi:hypothetical protein
MYWLKLFLMIWFSFGVITVAGLFWICKKSGEMLDNGAVKGISSNQRPEFAARKLSGELHSV